MIANHHLTRILDETGWAWIIPLHNGTTSVGFVMHITNSNKKKARLNPDGSKMSLTDHYHDQLQYVPGVRELIGDKGTFIEGSTKSTSDFSYSATRYSGDHFRLIGDAASTCLIYLVLLRGAHMLIYISFLDFVDPFFSSGVHIGMTGALSASATICASIKGEADEATAQAWHDAKVGIAHTR